MFRISIAVACGFSLVACATIDMPDMPGTGSVPQDRAESEEILPPPMQPPPRKDEFEIVGDYAGKQLTMSVNGREFYSGNRPLEAPGIRWQVRHGIEIYPATLVIEIAGCAEPVTLSVPETQEGALLIFRGCSVEMVAE